MRKALSALGMSALFALSASGQTEPGPDAARTFRLIGGESPEAMKELAYVAGGVAKLGKPAVDAQKATITVTGSPDRIALAAWIVAELDQPTKAADLTYLAPGGADSMARMFYMAHLSTPQQLQELVNIIRSMTEIGLISAYNPARAIVLSGTQAQVEQAGWLVKELDLAPDQALPPVAAMEMAFPPGSTAATADARAYHMRHNQARIFYLKNHETPQQIQEMVNVLRATTEMTRITVFSSLRAICSLGAPAQADAAAWLVSELEKPTPQAAAEDRYYLTPEYQADGEVRVFFVPGQTSESAQRLVNLIRRANIQRVTVFDSGKAIVIRGAAGPVASAEQVVQQFARN